MLIFVSIAILIVSVVVSAVLTVRFMMMQGAASEIDMVLNICMGLILAFAEVAFAAIVSYLFRVRGYFLGVLFFFTTVPLVVTSILASNLQLLNSNSRTEYNAKVEDAGYQSLLTMQTALDDQIAQLKSHPYYNAQNPINKSRLDAKIGGLLAKKLEVSERIAEFNTSDFEGVNKGFKSIGAWFGLSGEEFKTKVFFSEAILLEFIVILCTAFLTREGIITHWFDGGGQRRGTPNPSPPDTILPFKNGVPRSATGTENAILYSSRFGTETTLKPKIDSKNGRPSTGTVNGKDDRYRLLRQRILNGEQSNLSFTAIKKAVGGNYETANRYRQALVAEGLAVFNDAGQCVVAAEPTYQNEKELMM